MKRILAVVIGALTLSACSPGQTLRMGTGYVSHSLCAAAFITQVDADQTYREAVHAVSIMPWVDWAIHYEVDREHQAVRTRAFGGFEQVSVRREGSGCQSQFEPAAAATASAPQRTPPAPLLPVAGPEVVTAGTPRLRAAMEAPFAASAENKDIYTKALVVMQHGRIVAERYAPGYGVDTKVPGYSDTKSVITALIGILARQGKLAMKEPAPIAVWSSPGDPRRAITPDHLARMQSGLHWEESLSGGPDDAAQQRYLERDMAALPIGRPLDYPPGTRWQYSSGDTMVLARILRDAAGGTREGFLKFAHDELFDPLGMQRVEFDFDHTGTPMGGAGMFATARDWARFGTLYAQDGVVGERRILPEGWVEYAATPAAPAAKAWPGYGAGFWTNRGDSFGAKRRTEWGAPPNSFFASGHLGQIILIVPEQDLVIARFGWAHGSVGGFDTMFRQFGEIAAAVRETK